MNREDELIEYVIKYAKKQGHAYKRCECGAVHFWNPDKKVTLVPIAGQPCLMIVDNKAKKVKKKSKK